MKQKQQCPIRKAATTANLNRASSQTVKQLQNTKPLSTKQALIVQELLASRYGVKSNELRAIGRVMNIHDQLKQIRKKGVFTECRMENYLDEDGNHGKIGRIRLTHEGRERAEKLLGWD